MSLAEGTRLGPYEILGLLGSGGMGEVYRARDARLGREVAVKVLGATFAADPDRLRRFEQEARTLAALNHPNLMAVYDFGNHEGAPYLVSELLQGETLQGRLQAGPVGARTAADWGRQIAAGMAAAHQSGIIHRDLKPANVFLCGDGRVKILDFGLAKVAQPEIGPEDATLATNFVNAATSPGMTLGTVGYMAPEQVRGETSDARSDIFAFGVVLYEMLTGIRPFHRSTAADTMTAILRDDPAEPPATAPLPPALERIVRRCLEKQPGQRFQNASDLGFALEGLSGTSHTGSQVALPAAAVASGRVPLNPGVWRWLAMAAVVVLAVGAALAWALWPRPFDIGKLDTTPFSFEPGGQSNPVWSPNGKAVAFAASDAVGSPTKIYLQYLNSETATTLTDGKNNVEPFAWTPDSARILYSDAKGVYSISATGGAPNRLLDTTAGPAKGFGVANGYGAVALSPDGTALVGLARGPNNRASLMVSSPPGHAPVPYPSAAFDTENLLNQPGLAFSPDGKSILLEIHSIDRGRDEFWLLPWPMGSGAPRRVLPQLATLTVRPTFSWLPDSRHIILALPVAGSLASRMWKYDLDGGTPVAISANNTYITTPAVSPDGNRMVYTDSNPDFSVVNVSLANGQATMLLSTPRIESSPAWALRAPVLAYLSNRSGPIEIWLHRPGAPDAPLLTWRVFPGGQASDLLVNPLPSPDGTRVIFNRIGAATSNGRSTYRLWVAAVSGGAPERLTNSQDQGLEIGGGWSPDGTQFAFLQSGSNVGNNIALVSSGGQAQPRVIARDAADVVPVWSPQGDWIAYANGDADWILMSPDGKQRRNLGKLLGTQALAFSRDGHTLYGISSGASPQLFSVPAAGGAPHVIAALPVADKPQALSSPGMHFSLSPDGQHLTFSAFSPSNNLWLVTGLKQR